MLNFGHFLSDFLVLFVVHFAQFVVHRFCTTFVINYLSMCCKIKQDRIRITESHSIGWLFCLIINSIGIEHLPQCLSFGADYHESKSPPEHRKPLNWVAFLFDNKFCWYRASATVSILLEQTLMNPNPSGSLKATQLGGFFV